MASKHDAPMLGEDSPVNTVSGRLALYAALAGATGATVLLALRRHNRKPATDEVGMKATSHLVSGTRVWKHASEWSITPVPGAARVPADR